MYIPFLFKHLLLCKPSQKGFKFALMSVSFKLHIKYNSLLFYAHELDLHRFSGKEKKKFNIKNGDIICKKVRCDWDDWNDTYKHFSSITKIHFKSKALSCH